MDVTKPSVTNAGSLGPLAQAEALHDAVQLPNGDREWLRVALEKLLLIRHAEERIGDEVASGFVRCPCHLAIGQEAAAVGVARAVKKGDRLFGAHRSHAHFLALGGSLQGLFAEVLGRSTGVSRGMGGSMHLIDIPNGLYGTVPIVGATIPIAVGAALAAQKDGNGAIAVSFFGDGATEEGGFHESMNLAAVMKLPVLFVCENNLFSSHLHISLRQPTDGVSRYAEAHRVPWTQIDGNDVVAVSAAARGAVSTIRQGGGPHFLELVTYRWRGHVGPREDEDVGVQRKEDLHMWKGRDPVQRLVQALEGVGIMKKGDLENLAARIRSEVRESWNAVLNDPFPPEEALHQTVWTRGPST